MAVEFYDRGLVYHASLMDGTLNGSVLEPVRDVDMDGSGQVLAAQAGLCKKPVQANQQSTA